MPTTHRYGTAYTRRRFLRNAGSLTAAVCAARTPLTFAAESSHSARITEVVADLNNIHKWDNSNGDTWDPFWAEDGNLYAFNCDGRGFGPKGRTRNLAFNKLAGEECNALAGSQVNSMDEYGKGGEKGPDGATWKACGQECIDGIFYAFVSRNTYGRDSGDPLMRQTAADSSLIQSTDRGLTWNRSAQENYERPMWPGSAFGAPFFVHYGKNGGRVARDSAERYVYASSTNGFWNDGDSYILGRVERRRLSALRAGDWEYYTGGDGERSASWSPRIADARPILSAPAHCGQGPICYVPALDVYLLVAWYNTAKLTEWFKPTRMRYDFYQAPHPWGPWEPVGSLDDSFLSSGHMYGPSLCARFQQRSGSEVKVSMFTSGCPFQDVPMGLYKMWEIPLILRTRPAPAAELIWGDDPRVVYQGGWSSGDAALPALNPQARYTAGAGNSAELSFEGTGVSFLTEKGPRFGRVKIFLDGRPRGTCELETPNFPRISSVEAFAATGLPSGRHVLRVVNADSRYAAIEQFRVIR